MVNDILKTDALLAIMVMTLGLVSATEIFWQKLVLIVLCVLMVALRSFLKSQETWRK